MKIETIDEYISQFPPDVKAKLETLRSVIKESAPESNEKISYQMPTFVMNENLVHFAAYKNHIGFYPTPSGIEKFKIELSAYKSSKGAVQFPIDDPLPLDLIKEIVKFRVAENIMRAKIARKGKKEQ